LARDRAEFELLFQLLIHPMIDDRTETPSSRWPSTPVWPRAANKFAWQAYVGHLPSNAVPSYAAPSRADDVSLLPSTLVLVGTVDPFLDESIQYAHRLMHASVPTDLRIYSGAPHGFLSLASESALSRSAAHDIEQWLTRIIAGSPPNSPPTSNRHSKSTKGSAREQARR
jgi:acetyl esterase/lipase